MSTSRRLLVVVVYPRGFVASCSTSVHRSLSSHTLPVMSQTAFRQRHRAQTHSDVMSRHTRYPRHARHTLSYRHCHECHFQPLTIVFEHGVTVVEVVLQARPRDRDGGSTSGNLTLKDESVFREAVPDGPQRHHGQRWGCCW